MTLDKKQNIFSKLIGDKAFYKMVFAVAVPILIQNVITNFVNLLDNIMVGKVGTEQMSGVSIANLLLFVFNLAIFGATSGVGIFTAQYYGSKNETGMKHSIRFSMYWGLAIMAIGIIIFGAAGKAIINLYLTDNGAEGDIAATLGYGTTYLSLMVIGLPPFVISQVYAGTVRSTQKTMPPMVAGLVAVAVNLFLNYVLIYGNLGAPAMGVKGAAIATVVSRYVEMIILIVWCHVDKKRLPYFKGVWRSLAVPLADCKAYIKKGTPVFVNEVLWSLGISFIVQCYSVRGLTTVAALNIQNTMNNLFAASYITMGAVTGIIVGNILGSGDIEGAKDTSRKLMAFSTFFCALLGGLYIGLAFVFPNIYNTTDDVKQLATYIMIVAACFVPVEAIVNASYFTIRAGGRTFVTFLFDSFFTWVIPVPVAFMLSRLTDLYTVWMYLVIQTLEIIKVVIGFIILRSGIWCKKFVADGTLRVSDIADDFETSDGDSDGASAQNETSQNAPQSPEAWLVENLEGEPTTVVEPESDFLDDPKSLI
ncbi:MAG: MATE family efflux transporter [Clostridia bacterium]|nr:MATE family efflux transporter [Clostridia bacterium]